LDSAAGMAAGCSFVDEFEDEQPGQFPAGASTVAAQGMRLPMPGSRAPLGHYQQVLAAAPRLQKPHPAADEAAAVGQKRPLAGPVSAEPQMPLAGGTHTQQMAAAGPVSAEPQMPLAGGTHTQQMAAAGPAHAGLAPSRAGAAAADGQAAADLEFDGIFDFMM
jgi:hypothetical protein